MIASSPTISQDDFKIITDKISALNNYNRWKILEILRMNEKNRVDQFNKIKYYAMSTNQIRDKLEEKKIFITTQMIGRHLKDLREAGLVDRIRVKHCKGDANSQSPCYVYYITTDAFTDLLLLVNFFREDINTLVDLYKYTKESKMHNDCVMTVFNGQDKGKTLDISKDETAYIGRISANGPDDCYSPALILSNSYTKVSSIMDPHLKVYHQKGKWYILDESSENETYCSNEKLQKGVARQLPNNSIIKLSKGKGCALIYFNYN
ncbi:FHA domain-containing protein [Methanosphaera sp. BMS]|uniref:FHA domain-containing protein n=1 Tax=Methanosphaera sp. BMS TaxID=1789762 RepID=UPI000DC1C5FD|nr:FHA domain-containing protein [Methanosphaera sp. BMS]AWX31727.1 hypothetical protein AW729_00885 [Methanosphaera sp. BMS]